MFSNQKSIDNNCKHFRERQKQRNISDGEIDKCISKGSSKTCPSTGRIACRYNGVNVVYVIKNDSIKLITCSRLRDRSPTPENADLIIFARDRDRVRTPQNDKYSTQNDKYSTREGKQLKAPKHEKRTGKTTPNKKKGGQIAGRLNMQKYSPCKAVLFFRSLKISALGFWFAVSVFAPCLILSGILFLACAILFELVFAIQGSTREDLSFDVAETEDILLRQKCKAPVRHNVKEITVSLGGTRFLCRVHMLCVSHKDHAAPTVLLLHGNASSAFCFAELFDELSEKFNILAVDIPGFGRSTSARPPKHQTSDFYAKFISALLVQMSLTKVYVIGHSFGGFVASLFAAQSPQSVTQLLLIDPAGIFPTLGATGAYWAVFFKWSLLQFHRNLGRVGTWMFSVFCHARRWGLESRYWYAVSGARDSWGDRVMAEYISLSWSRAYWLEPMLPALLDARIPIATAYGRHDCIMPPHQGRALHDIFGWPTRVLEDSGHVLLRGKDAYVLVQYIIEFFDDVQREKRLGNSPVDRETLLSFKASFSTTESLGSIKAMYEYLGSRTSGRTERFLLQ